MENEIATTREEPKKNTVNEMILKHNEEDLSPLEEFVFCIMKKLFSLYNEEAQSTTIH